ncbi:hypothetical protein [Aquimarina sp. AU474]|uniref:hypothetical protein n=1 Tax=Aquimarina sp. AU474 TaxID=2108529 RepID=UPI000D693FE7|nr:hypothetical protein [Aquimarina sp. AU474]
MKYLKRTITTIVLGINLVSYAQKTTHSEFKKESIQQSYIGHSPTKHHEVALEVIRASKAWIVNFNKGNSQACVDVYDQKAIMSAMPVGIKKGITEISEFWTSFIKSGASNLIYTNVSIEVVNETTAFLSANWSMNIGRGIIYTEKWEKKNGKWLFTYDNFEVLEKFESPQKNDTNPVGSHIVIEDVIKASIEWTNGFNSGKSNIPGEGYSENATLNPIPFPTTNGKDNIQGFWTKLIRDGAQNLIYHNPIFTAKTDKSATLSSHWSMNIGEGKIYQEKWEFINNKWLLTYDEFEVIKQY